MPKNEVMKKECVKKMKLLNISKETINEFNQNGKVYCFEEKSQIEKPLSKSLILLKNEIEEKEGMVYYCIFSESKLGQFISFLYTSSFEEEWEFDLVDLKDYIVFAYVCNINYPELSEFGSIQVIEKNGQLHRIR